MILERDPLTENYLALTVAVCWPCQITPEQSFNILHGKSCLKKRVRALTPKQISDCRRIIASPNFKRWEWLEKRFAMDRYAIIEAIKQANGDGCH